MMPVMNVLNCSSVCEPLRHVWESKSQPLVQIWLTKHASRCQTLMLRYCELQRQGTQDPFLDEDNADQDTFALHGT